MFVQGVLFGPSVSNESGFISSGANSGSTKCYFLFILSSLPLFSGYFLKPVTSDTPFIFFLSVGGFLTSQGWPFNFTLTSDLVVHFLSALTTFCRPVLSTLHPTLPSLSCTLSPHAVLCQSHTRVIWPIFRAHTTFNGERWKKSAGRKFSKAQKRHLKKRI